MLRTNDIDGLIIIMFSLIVIICLSFIANVFRLETSRSGQLDCSLCHSYQLQLHQITKDNITRNKKKYLK